TEPYLARCNQWCVYLRGVNTPALSDGSNINEQLKPSLAAAFITRTWGKVFGFSGEGNNCHQTLRRPFIERPCVVSQHLCAASAHRQLVCVRVRSHRRPGLISVRRDNGK
ncbi:hypothetical protein KUCAC02_013287, partial [Chaenocephalus aceratus]